MTSLLLASQGPLIAPGGEVPVGGVIPYAGNSATVPGGWLICDGAAVSEAEFAALFAICGYIYGNPGGGNFNLPDTQQRFLAGAQVATEYDPGETGGEASHALTEAETGVHDHTDTFATNTQSASHAHTDGSLSTNNQSASHAHNLGNHTHGMQGHQHSMTHTHLVGDLISDNTAGGASERVRSGTGFNTGASSAAFTGGESGNVTNQNGNTGNQQTSHSHVVTGTTANQNTSHSHTVTGVVNNAGSGTAHENRPPFLAMHHIIKV